MKNALWIILVLGLTACGAEADSESPVHETPAPTEEELAEEASEEPAAEAPEVAPTEEVLPIAEDFEEEVAEAITEENYADALAEIEAELAPAE